MKRPSKLSNAGMSVHGRTSRQPVGRVPAASRLSTFAAALGVLVLAGGSSGSANQGGSISNERLHALALHAHGDLSQAGFDAAFRDMDPAALAIAGRFADGAAARLQPTGLRYDPAIQASAGGVPADALQSLSWDAARLVNASIPFSTLPSPPAAPLAIEATGEDYARALTCLTQAVYYEAAFEPLQGQAAVAQVVLNRVRHPLYPKTVCGVVFQGSELPTGCQFTFTCDGSLARAPAEGPWKQARSVAARALSGYVERSVGYATHYHADYVVPYWEPTLSKVAQIGAHIFYRWPGGLGAPARFNAPYQGHEMVQAAFGAGDESVATAAQLGEAALPTLVADEDMQRPAQEPVAVVLLDRGPAAPVALHPASGPKLVVAVQPPAPPRLAMPSGW